MKENQLLKFFTLMGGAIYLFFNAYIIMLYLEQGKILMMSVIFILASLIQLIVYFFVKMKYAEDKKNIIDYEYYRETNFNNIKPIEAGIILNDKNAKKNIIIVLIYELINDKIINVRYNKNDTFIKLNNITIEDFNKLDVDKRELLKIIFKGINDKEEYTLRDVLDKSEKDVVSNKIIHEIIVNNKVLIDMKYNESLMKKFEEYTGSSILGDVLDTIVYIPLVLGGASILISFIMMKYSIVLLCIYIVFLFIVILTGREKYIKNEYMEEYNKLKGLKNFLLNYSNLKEYDIKYVELYDKYYLYALSMGITDKVEKDYNINSYLMDNINLNLQYLTYRKKEEK